MAVSRAPSVDKLDVFATTSVNDCALAVAKRLANVSDLNIFKLVAVESVESERS